MKVYNDFRDFPHTKWAPYQDTEKCPPTSYCDVRGLETGEALDRILKQGRSGNPMLFDL